MVENPFTLISSRRVYENPWISVREDSVIRPGGKEGIFGIVTIGIGAHIVVVDDNNFIYLIKEFAYGIGESIYKIPGGGLGANESPLDSAKRELFEETGIVANTWIDLGIFHPLTTVIKNHQHLFLAKDITIGKQSLEEGEEIVVVKVPFSEAVEMVHNGSITEDIAIIGVLKAQKYIL